jgi:hypothetical protein
MEGAGWAIGADAVSVGGRYHAASAPGKWKPVSTGAETLSAAQKLCYVDIHDAFLGGCSSVGRARASQARGRGFESRRPLQKFLLISLISLGDFALSTGRISMSHPHNSHKVTHKLTHTGQRYCDQGKRSRSKRSFLGLTRKDSVYYFRRRMPKPFHGEVSLSLQTNQYRFAEYLAGQLNGAFMTALQSLGDKATSTKITELLREELDRLLREDSERHTRAKAVLPVYARIQQEQDGSLSFSGATR